MNDEKEYKMQGNNELIINKATMIIAVQYWLNSILKEPDSVVESVEQNLGEIPKSFTVKISSQGVEQT